MTSPTVSYQDHWIPVLSDKHTLLWLLGHGFVRGLGRSLLFVGAQRVKTPHPVRSAQGQAPSLKHQQYLMHTHDLNSVSLTHAGACRTLPQTFSLSSPPPASVHGVLIGVACRAFTPGGNLHRQCARHTLRISFERRAPKRKGYVHEKSVRLCS